MKKGWILFCSCFLCGLLLVGGCLRSAMAYTNEIAVAPSATVTVTQGPVSPTPVATQENITVTFEPMECNAIVPRQYTRSGEAYAFTDSKGKVQYRVYGMVTYTRGGSSSLELGFVALENNEPILKIIDVTKEDFCSPKPAQTNDVPIGYNHISNNIYYFKSAGGLKHYRASASVNGRIGFYPCDSQGNIEKGSLLADYEADKLLMASANLKVFVADAPYKTVIPTKTSLINMNNRLEKGYLSDNLVVVRNYLDQAPFTLRNNGTYADKEAMEAFILMVNAAKDEAGFESFYLCSVYRSYKSQKLLWDYRVQINAAYGRSPLVPIGSAYPGTSEHQSGLAFDIATVKYKTLGSYLKNTAEHKWLAENSWRFGFIVRYPEDKTHLTGIKYEPYHFRYVGRELAEYLYKENMCLEEYYDAPVVWYQTPN